MVYFKHVNNGEGPTKLIIGGVHGNEGKTTIELIKLLKNEDFGIGQTYIYNFEKTPYISTLNKEFYKTKQGQNIIKLIKIHKPDFYTELHSYNISHFEQLTSNTRFKTQNIPPLIDCGEYVLVSSVSPLIRFKYINKNSVCKTIEIPSFKNKNFNLEKTKYKFNKNKSINVAMSLLYLITKSNTRKEYEKKITELYPKQVDLAIKYVKEFFSEEFSPF